MATSNVYFSETFKKELKERTNTGIDGFYLSYVSENYERSQGAGIPPKIDTYRNDFSKLIKFKDGSDYEIEIGDPVARAGDYVNDDTIVVDITFSGYVAYGSGGIFLFYKPNYQVTFDTPDAYITPDGTQYIIAIYSPLLQNNVLADYVDHYLYIDLTKVAVNNWINFNVHLGRPILQHYHAFATSDDGTKVDHDLPYNTKTICELLTDRSRLNSTSATWDRTMSEGTRVISESTMGYIKDGEALGNYKGLLSNDPKNIEVPNEFERTIIRGEEFDDGTLSDTSVQGDIISPYYLGSNTTEGLDDLSEDILDASGNLNEMIKLLYQVTDNSTITIEVDSNTGARVSWGDNIVENIIPGESRNISHTYTTEGNYTIILQEVVRVKVDNEDRLLSALFSNHDLKRFELTNNQNLIELYVYSRCSNDSDFSYGLEGSNYLGKVETEIETSSGIVRGFSNAKNLKGLFQNKDLINNFSGICTDANRDFGSIYRGSSYGNSPRVNTIYFGKDVWTTVDTSWGAQRFCQDCKKLTNVELDLYCGDDVTYEYRSLGHGLSGCTNLVTVTFKSTQFTNKLGIETYNLFDGDKNLTTVNDFEKYCYFWYSTQYMFRDCINFTASLINGNNSFKLSSTVGNIIESAEGMFQGSGVVAYQDVRENNEVNLVRNYRYAFSGCSNLVNLRLSLQNAADIHGLLENTNLVAPSEDDEIVVELNDVNYKISSMTSYSKTTDIRYNPTVFTNMRLTGEFHGAPPQIDFSGIYNLNSTTLFAGLPTVFSTNPDRVAKIHVNTVVTTSTNGWITFNSFNQSSIIHFGSPISVLTEVINEVGTNKELQLRSTTDSLTTLIFKMTGNLVETDDFMSDLTNVDRLGNVDDTYGRTYLLQNMCSFSSEGTISLGGFNPGSYYNITVLSSINESSRTKVRFDRSDMDPSTKMSHYHAYSWYKDNGDAIDTIYLYKDSCLVTDSYQGYDCNPEDRTMPYLVSNTVFFRASPNTDEVLNIKVLGNISAIIIQRF